jgi:L-threonylcarbamoyladenylate synthase
VSPTTAAHVRADLGDDVDLVLDGGPSAVGVESTIVDVTGDELRVLRVGGVDESRLVELVGTPLRRSTTGAVAAPGTLASHYAPHARVELVTAPDLVARARALATATRRVGVLALDPPAEGFDANVSVLDPPRDLDDYARVLYARLRDADRLGLDVLLAVPPPETGVGIAVADRLRRAAAADG